MIELETLIPFFAASLLLGIAPGPDNIFVLTQSALHGKKAGIIVMLGLCTGLVAHTTAVALGVAVIFHTSAVAFSMLKFIGAGYLVYLAWQAFKASAEIIRNALPEKFSLRKLYLRGILMNITNPKVSLFFLAFLPQFADPSRGPVSIQIFLLGGVFILATLLVFGGIALLSGSIGQVLTRSVRFNKILNKVAGTVFLGLALKLATTER
ncbi:MAG: LysE family translocator [Desulfatibacillum sp.]|nr:LysE family translocator [Desulfatibacillum sp.]